MNNFSQLQIQKKDGRIRIALNAAPVGEDLCVSIVGGREHIGAIALGRPDAPCQCLGMPGHREEALAREIADMLAGGLSRRVAVIAGIHYDNISGAEIDAAVNMARELALECLRILQKDATI